MFPHQVQKQESRSVSMIYVLLFTSIGNINHHADSAASPRSLWRPSIFPITFQSCRFISFFYRSFFFFFRRRVERGGGTRNGPPARARPQRSPSTSKRAPLYTQNPRSFCTRGGEESDRRDSKGRAQAGRGTSLSRRRKDSGALPKVRLHGKAFAPIVAFAFDVFVAHLPGPDPALASPWRDGGTGHEEYEGQLEQQCLHGFVEESDTRLSNREIVIRSPHHLFRLWFWHSLTNGPFRLVRCACSLRDFLNLTRLR